jgi:hypothetical protein
MVRVRAGCTAPTLDERLLAALEDLLIDDGISLDREIRGLFPNKDRTEARRRPLLESRSYGDTPKTRRWCDLVRVEIIGQGTYYHFHKRFPDDQCGFVQAFLIDPDEALRWPLW